MPKTTEEKLQGIERRCREQPSRDMTWLIAECRRLLKALSEKDALIERMRETNQLNHIEFGKLNQQYTEALLGPL